MIEREDPRTEEHPNQHDHTGQPAGTEPGPHVTDSDDTPAVPEQGWGTEAADIDHAAPEGESAGANGLSDQAVRAFRQAEELVSQRRPREALNAMGPIMHIAEGKPSVQLLLGRAYYFATQLNQAEGAFARVLELDPSDHYARLALGRTLQRQGRLIEARAQLRLAATMHPSPTYQEALSEINTDIATRLP